MTPMEPVIKAVILAITRYGADSGSSLRLAMAILCAAITATLGTAAAGGVAMAIWIWAEPALGPAGASLTVSAGLLVACLTTLAGMRRILATAEPPPSPGAAATLLLSEATRLLKDHKGAALIAAIMVGLTSEHFSRNNKANKNK